MACATETESRNDDAQCEIESDSIQLKRNFDVWRPYIISNLRAKHLFPSSFPFLDDSEEDKILGKDDSGDYQGATKLLLEMVEDHYLEGDISVMKNFIKTLEQSEYTYMVSLLNGKTKHDELSQKNHKCIVKVFAHRICNSITEADICELTSQLWSCEVITDRQKEEISAKAKNSVIAATAFLLRWIPTVHRDWYNRFLNTLLKFNSENTTQTFLHLVEDIDPDFFEKHGGQEMKDRVKKVDACLKIVCRNKECHNHLCFSSKIHKLKGNQHVHYEVTGREFLNCINLLEHPDRGRVFDGFERRRKMYCKQCEHDLGNTVRDMSTEQSAEHYLLKIKGIAFLDEEGNMFTKDQWCKVPFHSLR